MCENVLLGVESYKSKCITFCQQVLSAKVVTNARSPGSKCYGLVTMSSSTEVTRCISHLDCTELHGQQIYVERVSEEADVTTCKVSSGFNFQFFRFVFSSLQTIKSQICFHCEWPFIDGKCVGLCH